MTRGLTLVELVLTITLAAIVGVPTGIFLSEHLPRVLHAPPLVPGRQRSPQLLADQDTGRDAQDRREANGDHELYQREPRPTG